MSVRKISQSEVWRRWDALPEALKEAVASDANSKLAWTICELHHVPEEKRRDILTLVGDVMFGFIHAVDLSREIIEATGIPPKTADAIAEEINHKIFAPIRGDIEKAYAPHTKEFESATQVQADEAGFAGEIRAGAVGPAVVDLSAPRPPVAPASPEAQAPSAPPAPFVPPARPASPEAPGSQSSNASVRGPLVIHEEIKAASPVPPGKRPLGGFFGSLRQERAQGTSQPPPAAKVIHYTQFTQPPSPPPSPPQAQPTYSPAPQSQPSFQQTPPAAPTALEPAVPKMPEAPAPEAPLPPLIKDLSSSAAVKEIREITSEPTGESAKKADQNQESELIDLRTFEKIKKQL